MHDPKNPLGYTIGDVVVMINRGDFYFATVSKVTPTGQTEVTIGPSGRTRRFTPRGREVGSGDSWHATYIRPAAEQTPEWMDHVRKTLALDKALRNVRMTGLGIRAELAKREVDADELLRLSLQLTADTHKLIEAKR